MKKILSLFLVLCLMSLTVISSIAKAETTEEVVIIPYFIPPDEEGNRIVTITQNQFVILGVNWGACTKGLAQVWAKTAEVQVESGGQLLFPTITSSQYWSFPVVYESDISVCVMHTESAWRVQWRYPLGLLTIGDHVYHMDYWNDIIHFDGADYNSDGKMDFFNFRDSYDFTIRVIP